MQVSIAGTGRAYLCLLADGFVDDVVVFNDLFLDGIRQVLHSGIFLLQVDVAQATVEEDLAGVKFEQEAELGVVDHGVAPEVEQGVVEVGQSLFEVTKQKVGYTLLEVGDSKILV